MTSPPASPHTAPLAAPSAGDVSAVPVPGVGGAGSTGAGRIAGAPISWGVCEVPGWGYQLSPERVLAEMTQVGLAATELGPPGFLPNDPRRAASVLREHHLASVGGFVPVILHRPGHDPIPEVQTVLAGYAETGAGTLVLSADSGLTGYDARPTLDEDGWATLLRNLDRLGAVAAGHGARGPAPARRHDGGERLRGSAGARWLFGRAVP